MSGFDDMIRSAAPGGNIGKPLMLALCSGEAAPGRPPMYRRNRPRTRVPAECLAAWAGC